jgi:hypothetical protein
MRTHAPRFLMTFTLTALLVGCGASDPVQTDDDPSAGGSEGTDETGGKGGSTKPAAGGAGGKAAPDPGQGGTPSAGGTPGSGGTPAADGGSPGTGGTAPTEPDAGAGGTPEPAVDAAAPSDPGASAGAPYGCTSCTRLFDGKTLDGWETVAGAWVIKEGALASTGKPNDIYTKEDIGDARIYFQVRQIMGNHKPCTTLFGTRPAAGAAPKRGLGGAQFQPPNGASWDYGVGGTFTRLTNPNFTVANWHQCEVLIKEAGSFRAACCPVGATPCKATEVLKWTGKGKKAPFNIMMHNGGLLDEYREIWIEKNPTVDDLVSTK